MPVVTKYVVERNGVEKMTFSSKAEADQYDKLLDTAESLEELLHNSSIIKDDAVTLKLAMYLAENKEELLLALGNKRKSSPKKATSKEPKKTTEEQQTLLDDLVIEPDENSYVPEDTEESYAESEDLADYSVDDVYNESDAA